MVWLVFTKFIKNLSAICNAMTETMRGDKKEFKWTHGVDKSFETLKQNVVKLLVLALLISTKYFKLNVMQVIMQ